MIMKKIICIAFCVLCLFLSYKLIPAYIAAVGELTETATLTEIDWSLTIWNSVELFGVTVFLLAIVADIFIAAREAVKK